ncbi:hypothetical protein [Nonomuraea aridisoli]|nr:hypothetical protein [Nonomuraea aridisoli]
MAGAAGGIGAAVVAVLARASNITMQTLLVDGAAIPNRLTG